MSDKNILFNMSIDSALEFYERVGDLEIDNEDTRFDLLMRMAKEGKFDCVTATSRTKEQVVKDLTEKHGFKIKEIS